jgi:aryl-alcohol dehydrogenase-like predicted oxidoreductase
MEQRRIGSLSVTVAGLGCNNFGLRLDAAATREVVHAALDRGIQFFDTADIYGGTRSEEFLGQALGERRKSVVVATKFGMPIDAERKGAHPEYIRRAVEDSLRRLGTDYIDLYQLHRPDQNVPIADTLGALDELVRAGKVREIGSSNLSAQQIIEAEAARRPGNARFVSVQNEYSLLVREPEIAVLPEATHLGIAFLPYFPLASGVLSGKYKKGQQHPLGTRLSMPEAPLALRFLSEENLEVADALERFAQQRGHTLLELAHAWLLARPGVASVIAGATSAAQIHANTAAITWKLSADELSMIDSLAPSQRRSA